MMPMDEKPKLKKPKMSIAPVLKTKLGKKSSQSKKSKISSAGSDAKCQKNIGKKIEKSVSNQSWMDFSDSSSESSTDSEPLQAKKSTSIVSKKTAEDLKNGDEKSSTDGRKYDQIENEMEAMFAGPKNKTENAARSREIVSAFFFLTNLGISVSKLLESSEMIFQVLKKSF